MNQREIKFRAKRTDYGHWAYGYFVKTPITAEWNDNVEGGHFFDSGGIGRYCIVQDGVAHDVNIKTLGEYTGLKDVNGTEIYESDFMGRGVVRYSQFDAAFYLESGDLEGNGWVESIGYAARKYTVDGNIYETPELLSV